LEQLTDLVRVIVIWSNNIDIIDPAMLRPGRFDKLLYVPLPDVQSRIQILQTLARKSQIDPQVNLRSVAEKCVRFRYMLAIRDLTFSSGADLAALIREAAVLALAKHLDNTDPQLRITVKPVDFEEAFRKVLPSVSEEEERKYLMLQSTMRKSNIV
jgi:SpoVK/Ycf46/Vps4 family AAA+-type ATPase